MSEFFSDSNFCAHDPWNVLNILTDALTPLASGMALETSGRIRQHCKFVYRHCHQVMAHTCVSGDASEFRLLGNRVQCSGYQTLNRSVVLLQNMSSSTGQFGVAFCLARHVEYHFRRRETAGCIERQSSRSHNGDSFLAYPVSR